MHGHMYVHAPSQILASCMYAFVFSGIDSFAHVMVKHIGTNTFHLKTFWKAVGFCCYGALLVQGYWKKRLSEQGK